MKAIQLVLTTEDAKLKEKIEELEERCKKLEISFPSVLQVTALTIPTKQFIEILLIYADEKVHEIEREERNKCFWNRFKKTNRGLYE